MIRVGLSVSDKKRKTLAHVFIDTEKIQYVWLSGLSGSESDSYVLSKVSDVPHDVGTNTRELVAVENQIVVMDRLNTAIALKEAGVQQPKYYESSLDVKETAESKWLIKTRKACGALWTHEMLITGAVEKTSEHWRLFLSKIPPGSELFIQAFLGVREYFFKAFWIGGKFYAFKRKFSLAADCCVYNSQDRCAPGSEGVDEADMAELHQIGLKIEERLRLGLFGFDVVRGNDGYLYVVDVNYFPTFKEIETRELREAIEAFILGRVASLYSEIS